MEQVKGVVKSVRKDRRGFQVNDVWYMMPQGQAFQYNKGDSVEFEFNENKGFKNVQGSVRVTLASAEAPSAQPSVPSRGGYDVGIAVGHAINNAVILLGKGSSITDIKSKAIDVYRLAMEMKEEAAAGKYSNTDSPY